MFEPSSFNKNYYLNMTNRGYTHDQVIDSIEEDRKHQFIKDIDELLGKKTKPTPKIGIVPRRGTIKSKVKKAIKR